MKQIALFVRNRENPAAIKDLQGNLYRILGSDVDITTYYLNEMDAAHQVEADAYLVLYEEMLAGLVRHIRDFSKVIVISRNFQRKLLEQIQEIPQGKDVLVINDSKASTLQTIYMIYELGFGHLNLRPYNEELMSSGAYDAIDTCIVANDSKYLIPPHITQVYNIQNRGISFETYQKLITLLGLETPTIKRNLLRAVRDELDNSGNFIQSYLSNYLKEQLMNSIIESISQAIVLLDCQARIHYINEKGYEIFHLVSGDDFTTSSFFTKEFLTAPDFKDTLMLFNGENYLVKKQSINLMGEPMGFCLILQNEKDLRDSELNLNQQLKTRGLYAKYTFNDIIACSSAMKQCIEIAKQVAPSDYTILIRGESGTGKELLAQSIHNFSLRKNAPFVAVNCAALPESLLESELFGYETGAFTGADKKGKVGLFEQAQHGTIFLDEIGDISPNVQSRLLRVIQERQVMRVGSDKIINIDVRIIAATNVNLEAQIACGKFRKDLFYRLNVITLNIAPLRNRAEDIMPLMQLFLGKRCSQISPQETNTLLGYSWPGNVRELENVAAYYKILGALPDHLKKTAFPVCSCDRPRQGSAGGHGAALTEAQVKDMLLELIAEHSQTLHGIGRAALLAKLTEQEIYIGEGKLKRLLSECQRDQLIRTQQGRSGTQITPEGLSYLAQRGK